MTAYICKQPLNPHRSKGCTQRKGVTTRLIIFILLPCMEDLLNAVARSYYTEGNHFIRFLQKMT